MSGCGTRQCRQPQEIYNNSQNQIQSNSSYPSYGSPVQSYPSYGSVSQCAPVCMPAVPAAPQFSPNATAKEKLGYNQNNAMSLEDTLKFVSKDGDKLVFKAEGNFRSFTTQNVDSRGAVDQYGSVRDANTTARREAEGFYAESKIKADGKNHIKVELGKDTALVKVDIPGAKTIWLDRQELLAALEKRNSIVKDNKSENTAEAEKKPEKASAASLKNEELIHPEDKNKTPEQLEAIKRILLSQAAIAEKYDGKPAKTSLAEEILANLNKARIAIEDGIEKDKHKSETSLRETLKSLDVMVKDVNIALTSEGDKLSKKYFLDEIGIVRNKVLKALKPYDNVIEEVAIQPQKNQPGVRDVADPARTDANAGPEVDSAPDPGKSNSGPNVGDSLDPGANTSGVGVANTLDPSGLIAGFDASLQDKNDRNQVKLVDTLIKIKSENGQEAASHVVQAYKQQYGSSPLKDLHIHQQNKFLNEVYGKEIASRVDTMKDIGAGGLLGWFSQDNRAIPFIENLKKSGMLQKTISAWNDIMPDTFEERLGRYLGDQSKAAEILKQK